MHAPMKLHRYQGSRNSRHLGVGEMAWLGRYFVPKHEYLCSDPQYPHNNGCGMLGG